MRDLAVGMRIAMVASSARSGAVCSGSGCFRYQALESRDSL